MQTVRYAYECKREMHAKCKWGSQGRLESSPIKPLCEYKIIDDDAREIKG